MPYTSIMHCGYQYTFPLIFCSHEPHLIDKVAFSLLCQMRVMWFREIKDLPKVTN